MKVIITANSPIYSKQAVIGKTYELTHADAVNGFVELMDNDGVTISVNATTVKYKAV